MPITKEAIAKETSLTEVDTYCPHVAYAELEVPQDSERVVSVTFTCVSRDQRWADTKLASYTWFDAIVRREDTRSNLTPHRILQNRTANAEFFRQIVKWEDNANTLPIRRDWLKGLQAGDVIQIIPKAAYPQWVNITKEAEIKIKYRVKSDTDGGRVEAPASPFTYPMRLDVHKREIRLLVIQPGTRQDPILASFMTVSLAGKSPDLKFDALSYCWGHGGDRAELSINAHHLEGQPTSTLNVTRSVDEAIRRLRQKDQEITIWIDAVCINQADLRERSEQVNLMSEIYSSANFVHIWLGEGNFAVGESLRIVRDIYNFNKKLCNGGSECSCVGTRHTLRPKDVQTLLDRSETSQGPLLGMHEVFKLSETRFSRRAQGFGGDSHRSNLAIFMDVLFYDPWFTRVWVVQEALLAKRALVHYAGEQAPWAEVMAVGESLESALYHDPHVHNGQLMAPIWATVKLGQPHDDGKSASQGILDVFLRGLEMKATDERDKLFALFSFGDETKDPGSLDELVQPNYDKPVQRVFADFTRWWIRTHQSLDILSAVHAQAGRAWRRTERRGSGPVSRSHNPSWTVCGQGRWKWAQATLQRQFHFKAALERKPDMALLAASDPLVLRLKGKRAGEISAIAHFPVEELGISGKGEADIAAVFDKVIDPNAFGGFWGSRVSKLSDVTPGMAMDCFHNHLQTHRGYVEHPPMQSLRPFDNTESQVYETRLGLPCIDRCFFKSSDGRFGLCPWRAEEGDVVALLDGGKVPFLLRRVGDRGVFELVGECYVNGIMDGESDAVTGELEDFNLV